MRFRVSRAPQRAECAACRCIRRRATQRVLWALARAVCGTRAFPAMAGVLRGWTRAALARERNRGTGEVMRACVSVPEFMNQRQSLSHCAGAERVTLDAGFSFPLLCLARLDKPAQGYRPASQHAALRGRSLGQVRSANAEDARIQIWRSLVRPRSPPFEDSRRFQ